MNNQTIHEGYLIKLLFIIFCFFHSITNSYASSEYDEVEVQLVTISPGEFYWSAFGHSAIRIKSQTFDKMFGFGYFNFADEDFFINFARGNMQYFLGVVDSSYELLGYKQEGRKVVLQTLNLTSLQKQQLVEKMMFLAKPENRYYHYDYFLNNCTSKIRDLIDEITAGEISSQLKPSDTQHSWNHFTFPATNQAWLNLGLAYGYGIHAYSNRNKWQLSVFTEVFSEDIKALNKANQLNSEYEIYYQPNELEKLNQKASFIKTHYAVLLIVGLLMLGLLFHKTAKVTAALWLTSQSLLGFGIVFLWFFTQHSIAALNINVLLFLPIAFLLLFKTINKLLMLNLFLLTNIMWIILAAIYTNLYLIGFCLINLLIWKNRIQA